MKRTLCFWLVLGLILTAGSAMAYTFVDKEAFLLLEEVEEGAFLCWRDGDGEHLLTIAEDTRVETKAPPAPGMLVIAQVKPVEGGMMAVSLRDYALDGEVREVKDGKVYLFDGSYFHGAWVRLPEGIDADALVGKRALVPVAPITGENVPIDERLYENDYSDFVEAVSMRELAFAEGTVTAYEGDTLVLTTRDGEIRAAITQDTKSTYECEVGRYIGIQYDTDAEGNLTVISMMPING